MRQLQLLATALLAMVGPPLARANCYNNCASPLQALPALEAAVPTQPPSTQLQYCTGRRYGTPTVASCR